MCLAPRFSPPVITVTTPTHWAPAPGGPGAGHLSHIAWFCPQSVAEGGDSSFFQRENLRLREVRCLAQGHTAGSGQGRVQIQTLCSDGSQPRACTPGLERPLSWYATWQLLHPPACVAGRSSSDSCGSDNTDLCQAGDKMLDMFSCFTLTTIPGAMGGTGGGTPMSHSQKPRLREVSPTPCASHSQ